jgi:hypothetical protein
MTPIFVYIVFLILSCSLWGTVMVSPIVSFGPTIHYIDIIFASLLCYGWIKRSQRTDIRSTIEYSIGKELAVFLGYTVLLVFYSLTLGCSLTNALRFCVNIFHYSLYYFIPFVIVESKQLKIFYRYLFMFLGMGYLVYVSQNIFGWQPNAMAEFGSMSFVEKVGAFYRVWNPVQQWLVAAACFSLTWIIFVKPSFKTITLFVGLLLFVFLSFTRNVYIGLIAAAFLLILQKNHYEGKQKKIDTIRIVIIIVLVCIILLPFFPSVVERFQLGLVEMNEEQGSYGHRVNILLVAQALMNNPWFGMGFENVDIEYDLKSIDSVMSASVNSGADSHLIMLYYRFGFIGMLLFSYISITFIRKTYQRIRIMGVQKESVFLIGALTYTLMIWIQAVASSTLLSEPSISINVTLWALSDCVWRFYSVEKRNPGEVTI